MFIVIELQKTGPQVANIVTSYESLADAESKYHNILAAAAVSSVEAHSAILLNHYGELIKRECYTHSAEE